MNKSVIITALMKLAYNLEKEGCGRHCSDCSYSETCYFNSDELFHSIDEIIQVVRNAE